MGDSAMMTLSKSSVVGLGDATGVEGTVGVMVMANGMKSLMKSDIG